MQKELTGVDAQVHHELTRLGGELTKTDAEVMSWLPIAIERSLHLKLGMGSMVEYCERVLRYDVHTARERLRVARALLDLPKTHTAVAAGDLSYTAAREITRVATDDTEAEWIAFARTRNAREVERGVVGREKGDLPSAPPKPAAIRDKLIFTVTGEEKAVILAAVDVVRKSIDARMSAGAALALVCRRPAPADSSNLPERSPLAMIQCEECARGWTDVRGERTEFEQPAVERRLCDPKVTDGVGKKTVEIPLATRRAVWRRDRGCCVVPGCRNHMFVEVHHLRSILEGGDHSMDNLALLCDLCRARHKSHYAAYLIMPRGGARRPSWALLRGRRRRKRAA